MKLNADDFGCVAAGRWLRGISIPADSAVMTLPVGADVDTEVGASISIPGASRSLPSRTSPRLRCKAVPPSLMTAGGPNWATMRGRVWARCRSRYGTAR
jgi:hypothetical protein